MLASLVAGGVLSHTDRIQGRLVVHAARPPDRPDGRPSTADSTNAPARSDHRPCSDPQLARNEGMGAGIKIQVQAGRD